MSDSYWARYWRRESSRRRFLKGSAVAGVGAASIALVGCGDDDDDDGGDVQLATNTPAAGASASATATEQVKRGGTYLTDATGDPPTIDPYGNISFLTKGFANYSYSRLYKYKTGAGIEPLSVRPTPDIAESAEPNADGTEWVIKLKPGVKFHNIAPVNGRAVTTEDVKFSWGRLTGETSPNKGQVAFVDKVDFPDASTAKFTLKTPNAAFLDILADTNLFYIMPTEAEGGFDPSKQMIGSGPWVFKNYQPSVKFEFDKNPGWYLAPDFPIFDKIEVSIIPEYAQRLAQFLSGKSHAFGINAEDLVSTKQQINDVQFAGTTGPTLSFFFFEPNGPFAKDERLRRAVSMAMNRDDLLELGYNVKKLRDAGLDVKTPWHNILPAGETRWWLDPKSSDMGEGAEYFKYNPTEAKKLVDASGQGGSTFKYQYAGARYGKTFDNIAEQQITYLNEAGIKTETEVQDYSSKYITQTFIGNFQGIAFGYETPFPEAGSYPLRQFNPNDNFNHGKIDDPEIWKLAQDQQKELNEEKRKDMFWQIQKLNGTRLWYVPSVSGAGTGWTAYQPNLRGTEFRTKGYGLATEEAVYRWLA